MTSANVNVTIVKVLKAWKREHWYDCFYLLKTQQVYICTFPFLPSTSIYYIYLYSPPLASETPRCRVAILCAHLRMQVHNFQFQFNVLVKKTLGIISSNTHIRLAVAYTKLLLLTLFLTILRDVVVVIIW